MRTFHIGGAMNATSKKMNTNRYVGTAKFTRLRTVENEEGEQIVLARNGEIAILNDKG